MTEAQPNSDGGGIDPSQIAMEEFTNTRTFILTHSPWGNIIQEKDTPSPLLAERDSRVGEGLTRTERASMVTCGSRWLSRLRMATSESLACLAPPEAMRSQMSMMRPQSSVVFVSAVARSMISS